MIKIEAIALLGTLIKNMRVHMKQPTHPPKCTLEAKGKENLQQM